MRDAVNLQPFRVNSESLDSDAVITASVIREFEAQKAAKKAEELLSFVLDTPAGSGRGRGRGRGRATAAGPSRLGRVAQLQANE